MSPSIPACTVPRCPSGRLRKPWIATRGYSSTSRSARARGSPAATSCSCRRATTRSRCTSRFATPSSAPAALSSATTRRVAPTALRSSSRRIEQLSTFHRAYYRGPRRDDRPPRLDPLDERPARARRRSIPTKLLVGRRTIRPYRDWIARKEAEGRYTWTLALYGTPAMAKEAGLSLEAYWREIAAACFLDDPDPIRRWRETFREIGTDQAPARPARDRAAARRGRRRRHHASRSAPTAAGSAAPAGTSRASRSSRPRTRAPPRERSPSPSRSTATGA